MKQFYLFCCLLLAVQLNAQINNGGKTSFDPLRDPVALKQDNCVQLLVSEFVLAKSLKARIGSDASVLKTYKNCAENGSNHLVFEGQYSNGTSFMISIPLLPDAQERYYYTSAQALICSTPGCNNCSILNGNCVGCCTAVNENNRILAQPLLSVQTSTDD